ncbi:hypothetical protein [Haloarcula halophila]|nr:hypothetical protein [Halomicroarcula sp. DFY41]
MADHDDPTGEDGRGAERLEGVVVYGGDSERERDDRGGDRPVERRR